MARYKSSGSRPGGPRRPARPKGLGTGRPKPASFARQAAPRPRKPAGRPGLKSQENAQDTDRLQKVLAHAGVDSRRACEDLILQGRVTVDGKVVRELGTRVDPETSRVEVDGQRIKIEKHVYYAVNKPKGYVSTNDDPSGRPRVVDLIPEIPQRVYTVGRLDEDSTGLILLTNDGELANRLAHPRFGVEKLYKVLVAGLPTPEVLRRVTDGVWLADGKVRAKRVKITGRQGEATTLELVLAEGKNREVRRIFAKLGHKVMSLTRVAVGPILLKGLGMGEFRPLSKDEVELLHKAAAGIAVGPARAKDRRPPAKEGAESKPAAKPSTPAAGIAPTPKAEAPAAKQAPNVSTPPGKIVPNMILPSGAVVGARPGTGGPRPAPAPAPAKPLTILPSGAVVGAKPGTGPRPAPAKGRGASGPSGPGGGPRRPSASSGDRRQPPAGAQERRPTGPSGARPPRPPKPEHRQTTGTSVAGTKPPRPKGEERPSGRRIIGIDANLLQSNDKRRKSGGSGGSGGDGAAAGGAGGGSGPQKPKQRRPPRAAHGVKRKPRDGGR